MKTRIVVGSRGSKLAMIQTEAVVARIRELHPALEINIQKIVTTGDRDQQTQLEKLGIAIFVRELEEALLDKRIDLAVHSLKDMPTELPQGLHILAVMDREDPRDTLVAGSSLDTLAHGARIGTDSLRRSVQLTRYRPDLRVGSIRGNVDTRLRKVAEGEFDGVIVAAAALSRLGWADRVTQYLPLEWFLPAVGQGALAIESRADDSKITELVSPLNHLPTWRSVMAERAFLRALGGGCRAPIAALGSVSGDILKLEGMIASTRGAGVLQDSGTGNTQCPEEIGISLANRLLERGGAKFVAEVKGENR